MALLAYDRLRLFWGAFDLQHDIPAYAPGQRVSLGASAAAGVGIGARRAQLVFSRVAPAGYSEDVDVTHQDFVNYTGGAPDDTWTTGDFTTLEGLLATWWATVKTMIPSNVTLREIRWYRLGVGVPTPNPAERVTASGVAGTAANPALPPQVAMSVTMRTASRPHWGRAYLPASGVSQLATDGRIANTTCDTIAGAYNTLYTGSAAADFMPVVYSPTVGSALAIEKVQMDNIYDVIRSRRWEATTYRKVYP